jgi:hypothetical protein
MSIAHYEMHVISQWLHHFCEKNAQDRKYHGGEILAVRVGFELVYDAHNI